MTETMTTVRTQDIDGVAVITLNRPERMNAITEPLLDDFNCALQVAQESSAIGAIVITGAGRAFCAGDDLVEQQDMEAEDTQALRRFAEKIQDVTRNIMFGETPVIAAVNGWAVGGAFSWPMNCDLAVWDEGARGFFPELDHGLFVSGGVTWLLPQLVGLQRANDLFYSNRKVDAAALQAMGLAGRVAPAGKCVEEAVGLGRHIAGLPPAARAGMKRCVTAGWKDDLENALEREVDVLVEVLLAGDWKARIAENFGSGKGKA
jgi:enoyl-CoA hydratase/carnithine racemase